MSPAPRTGTGLIARASDHRWAGSRALALRLRLALQDRGAGSPALDGDWPLSTALDRLERERVRRGEGSLSGALSGA